jgi:hypothetical protein
VPVNSNGDRRAAVLCDDDWVALERAGTIIVDARCTACDRSEAWVRIAANALHLSEVYDVRCPPLPPPLPLAPLHATTPHLPFLDKSPD